VTQAEKLLDAMRRNPRGDWTIDDIRFSKAWIALQTFARKYSGAADHSRASSD
jgi:hypothetical protein